MIPNGGSVEDLDVGVRSPLIIASSIGPGHSCGLTFGVAKI